MNLFFKFHFFEINTVLVLFLLYRCVHGAVELFSKLSQFDISNNNYLTTFNVFPKEYEITFEVYLTSFTPGNGYCLCGNLFRFTTGNDDFKAYGDRLLGVWFMSSGTLVFDSSINGITYRVESKPFTLGWKTFNISQLLVQGSYFSILKVDGITISSIKNNDTREFTNVNLYFSDPYYIAQPGYLKNLLVTKGCSESNMYCKPQLNVAFTVVVIGKFLIIRFDANYKNAEETAFSVTWEYFLPTFIKLEPVYTSVDVVKIGFNKYMLPQLSRDGFSQTINASIITARCLVCESNSFDIPIMLYYENKRGNSWKSIQKYSIILSEICSIIPTNQNYIQDSGECTKFCNWTIDNSTNSSENYICTCSFGWYSDHSNYVCIDINECNSSNKPCNWTNSVCTNIEGSYICSCESGWKLNKNNDSCVDINECNSLSKPCNWTSSLCTNIEGSYICSCESGWMLNKNNDGCIDINECNSSSKPCNWKNSVCTNLEGSYTCTCESGWALNDNNNSCVDINECNSSSKPCNWTNSLCTNIEGSYICSCESGWMLNKNNDGCIDINECNSSSKPCNWTNSLCTNIEGSYICSCESGWMLNKNNDRCIDINECISSSKPCNWTNSLCTNIEGSYTCTCESGWELNDNNDSCVDINECNSLIKPCNWTNSLCTNIEGSYICLCESGWMLNKNNDGCIDINECNSSSKPCKWTNSVCTNIEGSYICSCKSGWALNKNNDSCVDINECRLYQPCNQSNSVCTNIDGSYMCTCEPGWSMGLNNVSCVKDLIPWSECSETCGFGFEYSYLKTSQQIVKLFDTCINKKCPVDGKWSSWIDYESCSNSCGICFKRRERYCTNPLPGDGGSDCFGQNLDIQYSNNDMLCPVHGGWTQWSLWSLCSQPCQGGIQTRHRSCTNPSPKYDGLQCIGNHTEHSICYSYECEKVSLNLNMYFTDEEYIDLYSDPTNEPSLSLNNRIKTAIKNLYNIYIKNLKFDLILHFIKDGMQP